MMFRSAVLLLLTILSGIKEEEASVATRLATEKVCTRGLEIYSCMSKIITW